MIMIAMLLLGASPTNAVIIDPPTGKPCPTAKAGYDIYDMDAYQAGDILNVSPNMMTRCLKIRQRLLDQQTKLVRSRAPK
jgi:hypothetical protein